MNTLTIIKVCAVIGIADALYLMWHKFKGTDVACPLFPKEWCRRVQYSPQSITLGVPNSVWGFLLYASILLFASLQPDAPWWPLSVLVGAGFAFSLYFVYVQAFVLRAFCTWCIVSALNFVVLFWVVFLR